MPCNVTHNTKCGDTLPTDIPKAFTSEELPWEEEAVLPESTQAPEEDPTTEAPDYPEKATVVCAPTFVFIFSHLCCVLIGIILCNMGCIYQKIKSCFSQITHRASYSLEEGKSRHRKKKGKKRYHYGKQQKQTAV